MPVPLEGEILMWLLLLCVSNATEDMGSEQFSLYWVQQETALWASLHWASSSLSFFLSFLLISVVVGTPQHQKQKHKRDEQVGGIDRCEG